MPLSVIVLSHYAADSVVYRFLIICVFSNRIFQMVTEAKQFLTFVLCIPYTVFVIITNQPFLQFSNFLQFSKDYLQPWGHFIARANKLAIYNI